jgi:hypothetical protein
LEGDNDVQVDGGGTIRFGELVLEEVTSRADIAPGQLTFDAPEYIRLEQDKENNVIRMNIEDVEDETQKEMWGAYSLVGSWEPRQDR